MTDRRGAQPSLGVILLDLGYEDEELSCSPQSAEPRFGSLPEGFLEHPGTWALPTVFRVAKGCTIDEMAAGSDVAGEGLRQAASALAPRVDLITADCAWTWFRRDDLRGVGTPVLSSGLALLDVARGMSENVVIAALSRTILLGLMKELPPGVRIVGLDDAPEWTRFHDYEPDMSPPIDRELMGDELLDRMRSDFATHGQPGAVVLECTALPQFRDLLIAEFGIPVLDMLSFVHYLLGTTVPRAALVRPTAKA